MKKNEENKPQEVAAVKKDWTIDEMQALVDEKAAKLSEELKLTVTPLLFKHTTGEWIVGYLKQPGRRLVRTAYDTMEKFGKMFAGEQIINESLIKEHSDMRIISEAPEFDSINNWACIEGFKLIEFSVSVTKKNMTLLS